MHHVTFHIDTDNLQSYTDEYLASLWHIAQANPAPIRDRAAGELAEHIGREIIRRWLRWAGAPLWNHQGRHYYSIALTDLTESEAPQDSTEAPHASVREVK